MQPITNTYRSQFEGSGQVKGVAFQYSECTSDRPRTSGPETIEFRFPSVLSSCSKALIFFQPAGFWQGDSNVLQISSESQLDASDVISSFPDLEAHPRDLNAFT